MNYRFYISYGGTNVQQVYPLNWLECSLIDEKEKGQVFYRRKFNGSLTFGAGRIEITEELGVNVVSHICEDYDIFNNIRIDDPCSRIELLILKDLDIYYEAYFSISEGEWDFDNKLFTITPLPLDDYFDWDKNGDFEYNILTAEIINGIAPLSDVTTIYENGGTTINYTRNIYITDVIEYLAKQTFGAGVTIFSTFFNSAINPITLNTNRYRYLTIAQKSDIKFPTSSNPATIGLMSFNQCMEILKCMNLRWEYNLSSDTITIEHISNWSASVGPDIRTQELTRSTNKYKHLTEEMPKYEYFKWVEAENEDFVGLPIWYDSICINQESDNNSTELNLNVTTDIEYIIQCVNAIPTEESKISNSGWVIFANEDRLGTLYIYSNYGFIEGTGRFNMDMSWGRLHICFFKFERQLMTGYMNGGLTNFISVKKTKIQECSIILCETFNPKEYLTTELGEFYFGGEKGYVRRAVIKPYGEINLELIYGPVATANPGIGDIKVITITEERGFGESSDFYANLTVPADGDLTVDIDVKCYDAVGNPCTTGYITLTILTGALTGTINIPWCVPLVDPAVCININDWDSMGAPGWFVVFSTLESACP